ncbi:hypothetical protein [Roseovarius pacificus]
MASTVASSVSMIEAWRFL